MIQKVLGVHLVILFVVGTYFAFNTVAWQHHAITAFVPTQALVTRSSLGIHRGKHTSYTPDVSYSFTFNGTAYTSSRVLPFSEDGSSDWAREILRHFAAGSHVTAYVNPANPNESILWRVHSVGPYVFLNGALVGLGVGMCLLFGFTGIGRNTMLAVPIEGRHLLLPVIEVRKRQRDAVLSFFAFTLATLPVWTHFVLVAEVFDFWAVALPAILVIFWLFLGFNAWRTWSVARHVSDARLIAHPVPMKLGQPFEMHVEFDAHQPLRVRGIAARIICTEHYYDKSKGKNAYGTRTHMEQTAELAGPQDTAAGQIIIGDGQTTVDDSHPASWDGREKKYPYYTWEIRIGLDLINLPDYKGAFPLTVEN